MERREVRYQNRKKKREGNKHLRNLKLGTLEDIFSYENMYKSGIMCCKNVRWKQSTQNFERSLFSRTQKNIEDVLNGKWKPKKPISFIIRERGKERKIEAPSIDDRQIEKIITNKILKPLYSPVMIYNNGASQTGKGFDFSIRQVKKDLMNHFKKYGKEGKVILIDFSGFFPNAEHSVIFKIHENLIEDEKIRGLCDNVVKLSTANKKGMPLGVEVSQLEMMMFPSQPDNFLKCQCSIKGMGHYADDYYLLIPPDVDAKEVLKTFCGCADKLGLIINEKKTRIQSLTKPFKYCKKKFFLTDNGHVIITDSKEKYKRNNKRMNSFYKKLMLGEISYLDIYNSFSSFFNNKKYCSDKRIGKLRRKFFNKFNFYPEDFEKAKFLTIKTEETKKLLEKEIAKKLSLGQKEDNMEYIVYKRINEKTLAGEVNIPALTICKEVNNGIYVDNKMFCLSTSELAHQHLARNNDLNGLQRGKLIQRIQKELRKEKDHQKRWDKVWESELCQKYKKEYIKDHWLWNHDFFNAPIEDLKSIAELIGIRR